jgi:hypothetical protein
MARAKVRIFAYDPAGRPLGNAKALIRESDGSTLISGAFDDPVAGSAITEKVSNAQAEIEFWMAEAKDIAIIVTDNNNTAYPLHSPGHNISFDDLSPEIIPVYPPVGDLAAIITHPPRIDNPHQVTKTQVGLGNVDNISAMNMPVSILQGAALALKIDISEKGAPSGVATLDGTGKLIQTQLGTYIWDQGTPSAEWIIPHGLGRYPAIDTYDSAGNHQGGDVIYDSLNQLRVIFKFAFGGLAYLN